MNRSAFIAMVQRTLGYPMVNVELTEDHYNDAIYKAMQQYIKYANDNATQTSYCTVLLSAGCNFYQMAPGTVDVIKCTDDGRAGSINTLFTMENFLYSQGAFNFNALNSGSSLVSYHITLGFLDTIKRYTPSKYTFKYHKESNLLEVNPAPDFGNSMSVSMLTSGGTIEEMIVDSPGFILTEAIMLEGATEPGWTMETFTTRMLDRSWIIDYVTALCKITLGEIRRKTANASAAAGNASLQLNGAELMQEGRDEKKELEEKLQNEECWHGYGISWG